MHYRLLGRSSLRLSTIGLGTWALGGPYQFGWGPQDDRQSVAAIQRAIDGGVNWIDTAATYGLGHAEEVVGQAVAGRRDRVLLATKCGLSVRDGSQVVNDARPEAIRAGIDRSLRRLGVDVVDLLQLHWPDPAVPVEESWAAMDGLVREGKARFIGVSNLSLDQIRACQAIAPIASVQPLYNLLQPGIEGEYLDFCEANGIGVVVYSPLASGLLSGGFDPARLAADDWRRRDPRYQQPAVGVVLEAIERLRAIAEQRGATVGQLAIAWVLRQPAISSAIVGARRTEQVEAMLPAADLTLSPEEIATIDREGERVRQAVGGL